MKKKLAFLILLSLVNCKGHSGSNWVTKLQIEKAQELCVSNGGVQGIEAPDTFYDVYVYCSNNSKFKLRQKRLQDADIFDQTVVVVLAQPQDF